MSAELEGKRILVTGPTGQVARPLVAALAQHNEVFGLARFSKAEDREAIEALGARTIAADLGTGSLEQVPQDLDYVLNLAVVKTGDWAYDMRANAEGVGADVQGASARVRVRRILRDDDGLAVEDIAESLGVHLRESDRRHDERDECRDCDEKLVLHVCSEVRRGGAEAPPRLR